MPIYGLKSGHKWTRAGKLKIGEKTDSGAPKKLDYFRFASEDEDLEGQFRLVYGDEPKKVDIVLLDEDLEFTFPYYYQAWRKSGLWCEGDGRKATRQSKTAGEFAKRQMDGTLEPHEVTCSDQCPVRGNGCMPKGMLRFLLSELRTIRYFEISVAVTSIPRILGRIEAIRSLSRSDDSPEGHITGIPLSLFVFPFQGTTKEGKKVTAYGLDLDVPIRPIDLIRGKGPTRIPETAESAPKAERQPEPPGDEMPDYDDSQYGEQPPPIEETPPGDVPDFTTKRRYTKPPATKEAKRGEDPGSTAKQSPTTATSPATPIQGGNPNFDAAQRNALLNTINNPLFDVDRGGWVDKARKVASAKDAADLVELAARALKQRIQAEAEKLIETAGEGELNLQQPPPPGEEGEETGDTAGVEGFLDSLEKNEAAAKSAAAETAAKEKTGGK